MFKTILKQVIAKPDAAVKNLKIDQKQHDALLALNAPQMQIDFKTIDQWFHQIAEVHAEQRAICVQGKEYTYSELNQRANVIAKLILDANVPTQSHVGLCMKPGVDLAASILAVVKTGNIFLPIDVDTPLERIKFLLEDSQASVFLSDVAIPEQYKDAGITCCNVTEVDYNTEVDVQFPVSHLNNGLYTIYTSGTTGVPKGVTVSHQNLANYIQWEIEETAITAEEQFLLINNFAFDAVYSVFFGALLSGATLHMMAKEEYLSPDVVTNYVQENQISLFEVYTIHGEPALAKQEFCGANAITSFLNDWRRSGSHRRSIEVQNGLAKCDHDEPLWSDRNNDWFGCQNHPWK